MSLKPHPSRCITCSDEAVEAEFSDEAVEGDRAPSSDTFPPYLAPAQELNRRYTQVHAKQGKVKFLGSYPAVGEHAHTAREHADARWREADDWVESLRHQIT